MDRHTLCSSSFTPPSPFFGEGDGEGDQGSTLLSIKAIQKLMVEYDMEE